MTVQPIECHSDVKPVSLEVDVRVQLHVSMSAIKFGSVSTKIVHFTVHSARVLV